MGESKKYTFQVAEWISAYLLGDISEREENMLNEWLQASSRHQELFDSFCEETIDHERLTLYTSEIPEKAFRLFLQRRRKLERNRRMINWIKYAAVLVLLFTVGGYGWRHWLHSSSETTSLCIVEKFSAHLPVITLSDGQEVALKHTAVVLNDSRGVKVAEQNSGSLVYFGQATIPEILEYHNLRTPAQCDYRFVLSDGTKVWANAKTSVTYPVVFGKDKRVIRVQGEVYLEVAKETERPFYVQTDDLTVNVLGTSFNVNSYEDEDCTIVTLAEGRITAEANGGIYSLFPNQQLCFRRNTGETTIRQVEVSDVVAWRTGIYIFRGQTLQEVCRVLQRWYDVEIIFENPKYYQTVYTGIVYKEEKIEDFIRNLNHSSGYHCRIEDGKVYIR